MRTDYKDFIASTENRHYRQIDNDDGTISLVDETVYTQEGDKASAGVLNELSQNAIWPLQYAKSSTTHQLTGLSNVSGIVSCVFTATADFAAGDTVTVDGEEYEVLLSNGETADDNLFVSGATVSVVVDIEGKKVNFKSGGGLSASKLALANATAGDVRSGKKFYAGGKEMQTGTLITPKVETGSFYADIGEDTTINLSFNPTTVIAYRQDSQYRFYLTIAFWYAGYSYITTNEPNDGKEYQSTTRIVVDGTKVTFNGSRIDGNEAWPFYDGLTRYIAVG